LPVPKDIAHHRAKVAANDRWSRPGARKRQSEKIREARQRLYEQRVDPDGVLEPRERAKAADNLMRADMARLALQSARARRAKAS
jgi:hypothetical protein